MGILIQRLSSQSDMRMLLDELKTIKLERPLLMEASPPKTVVAVGTSDIEIRSKSVESSSAGRISRPPSIKMEMNAPVGKLLPEEV